MSNAEAIAKVKWAIDQIQAELRDQATSKIENMPMWNKTIDYLQANPGYFPDLRESGRSAVLSYAVLGQLICMVAEYEGRKENQTDGS